MTFADVIHYLRTNESLTQEELARGLSISTSTIAMWETGKREPSRSAIDTLADFFHCDMDFICGRIGGKHITYYDALGNAVYEYITENGISREPFSDVKKPVIDSHVVVGDDLKFEIIF